MSIAFSRSSLLLLFPLGACIGGGVNVPSKQDDTGSTGSTGSLTVSIGPNAPGTNDDLVATVKGEGSNFTFAWTQDGTARGDLTDDTVPASETTKGETWKVVVQSDGGGEGNAQIKIQNTAPTLTALTLDPTDPSSSDPIVATPTTEDADGDEVTVTYDWALDGTSSSETSETLPGMETDRGQHLVLTATPFDGEDEGEPLTAEADIGNGAPFVKSASLSPTNPKVSDDIVVTPKGIDPDKDPVTFTYHWYVDGVLNQVGPVDTLSAGSAEVGQTVYVEITPNDGFVDGDVYTTSEVTITDGTIVGTGQAGLFWQGEVAGDKTTVASGKYGFAFYPYDFASDTSDLNNELCATWIDLAEGPPISLTCTGCDYSYSTTADSTTGSSGSSCAALTASTALADEATIGSYFGPGGAYEVEFGIGYAASTTYGFAGAYMYQAAYAATYGWFLFGYDYPSRNSLASDYNGTVSWTRPIRDRSTTYEVYYSY